MTIKGIIFDLYGTVIDIETDENMDEIFRGISHFLTYHNIHLHRGEVRERYWEILKRQKAESREDFPEIDVVKIWASFLNSEGFAGGLPRHKMAVTLAQMFRAISRRRLALYPEVKKTLDDLRPTYHLALVSDAQPCFAMPEIKAVGLDGYFSPVIISASFGYRKPDPRLYQEAIRAMKLDPSEIMFVGNDMFRDISGAQRCGLKTLFFDSNQGAKSHENVTPDYATARFDEIPKGIELHAREAPAEPPGVDHLGQTGLPIF